MKGKEKERGRLVYYSKPLAYSNCKQYKHHIRYIHHKELHLSHIIHQSYQCIHNTKYHNQNSNIHPTKYTEKQKILTYHETQEKHYTLKINYTLCIRNPLTQYIAFRSSGNKAPGSIFGIQEELCDSLNSGWEWPIRRRSRVKKGRDLCCSLENASFIVCVHVCMRS